MVFARQEPRRRRGSGPPVKKAIAIALLIGAVLTGVFCLTLPEVRYRYLGVKLGHHLKEGDTDRIMVELSLERGQEIRAAGESSEPSLQESYQAKILLQETVKETSDGLSLSYQMKEMSSEQWEWTRGEIGALEFLVRVFPTGTPSSLEIRNAKSSALLEDSVMLPMFTMLWPKLPKGMARAGKSSWTAQVPVSLELSLLGKNQVSLQHALAYKMGSFQKTESRILAQVNVVGRLRTEHPQTEGTGAINGVVLIDPESGKCIGGQYSLEETVKVQLSGLPEFQWAQVQNVTFYRLNKDAKVK